MHTDNASTDNWSESSMLNEAAAVYPASLTSMLGEIFERYEPVKGVRYLTAAVERQLAKKKKTQTPYAAALMRGLAAREELKLAEGGSYSSEETRKILGISKTAVLKRYDKGQLVGWREASQSAVRFPVWQFKDGDVLPGLPEVLEVFAKDDVVDDWTRILFFLSVRHSLDKRRPLDLLRDGEIQRICDLAEAEIE